MIIIENAESIIYDRNNVAFDALQVAVYNLLNIIDGLLSDTEYAQIIVI